MKMLLSFALVLVSCCTLAAQTVDTIYVLEDGAYNSGYFYVDETRGHAGDMWLSYDEGASRVFTFSAEPGEYRVWATWQGDGGSYNTKAVLVASVGGVDLATSAVLNQDTDPTGDTSQGGKPFQTVLNFTIEEATTVVVEWSRAPGGDLVYVDAIAYRRGESEPDPPPAPPTDPTINEAGNIVWTPDPSASTTQWKFRARRIEPSVGSWIESVYNFPISAISQPIGETWEYQIAAYLPVSGDWSESYEHTQGYPDPAAPTTLSATGISTSEIKLFWADTTSGSSAAQETGFEIWRSDDEGESYSLVHTTAANVTTWTDSGLGQGQEYRYKVRAVRADPEAFSSYAGPVTKSTINLEGFQSGYPDGPVKAHVSGAIATADLGVKIVGVYMTYLSSWTDYTNHPERPYGGSFSADGSIVGQPAANQTDCGTRTLKFIVYFYFARDADEEGDFGDNLRYQYYHLTVGRNGKINVVSEYGSESPGTTSNISNYDMSFRPVYLKELLADDSNFFGRRTAGDSFVEDRQENGIAIGSLRAWSQYWKTFAGQLYSSMINDDVDWKTIIPRCPGEDLDEGSYGSGGSGGSGTYTGSHSAPNTTHSGSVPTASELSTLLPGNIELNSEASPIVSFQMSEVMGGQGNMLGFSSGNMWAVDLTNLGGFYEPLATALNDRRLWIRGALLVGVSLFYLGKFRALLS